MLEIVDEHHIIGKVDFSLNTSTEDTSDFENPKISLSLIN